MLIVIGSGALAAWIAGAATSDSPRPPRAAAPRAPADARSGRLAADIAHLHARLQPQTTPRRPGRNLFEFEAPRAAGRAAPAVGPAPVPLAPPAPPPVFTLDGIAEDPGADGPVRTAIISGLGQLFLAKEGQALTPRYKVLRIGADVVELSDTGSASTIRLALK